MTRRRARKLAQAADGPCYDFCSCWVCWNGWKEVSFLTRLRWRIATIWAERVKGRP